MAKREYSNGYIPKIEYWLSVSKQAIQMGNIEESEYALQKAEYFMGRQKIVYNNHLINQLVQSIIVDNLQKVPFSRFHKLKPTL